MISENCFSIVSINSSCSRHSVYIRCSLTLFQKQLFLCFAARKPSFETFPKYFPISKTNVCHTSAVHPVRDLEHVLDIFRTIINTVRQLATRLTEEARRPHFGPCYKSLFWEGLKATCFNVQANIFEVNFSIRKHFVQGF